MDSGNDDLGFDDYESADLEVHGEDMPETDKALGTVHDDDFETGHEPKERLDQVEKDSRYQDYENMKGRVRTGHDNELDLSRVNLDGGASASGANAGADWESNQSTVKGHTAMDGTGIQHDTRGSVAMTGQHEDVDPELHKELRDAGERLGVASVNTSLAGFAMASAQYISNKERWRRMPEGYKQYLNAVRRMNRSRRDWEEMRADSVSRKYREVYGGFVKDREAEDLGFWLYGDNDEKARLDGIDQRSAMTVAERWRRGADEKEFDAFVVRYAAFLAGVQTQAIRGRFRRNKAHKDLAEFVLSVDLQACGCVFPGGFDKEQLLDQAGDELAIKMETPRSDLDRRTFIINSTHDLFAAGALIPPYVYRDLSEMLDEVVAILQEAGVDMSEPDEEVDWARV